MSKTASTLEIVDAPSAVAPSTENLNALANEINETHAVAKSHAQLAVVFAIRTGILCERAKDALDHGDFGDWLAKHCPQITDRTARRYMALVTAAKAENTLALEDGKAATMLPERELIDPDFLTRVEGDTKYRDKITAKVRAVVGEGSLTDLYKDWEIIHGPRNVDEATGKRVHYEAKKKKLTPDQVARQNRAAAMALFTRALGDLQAALNDKHARRYLEAKDWVAIRKLARDRMKQLDALADKAEAAAAKGGN